IPSLSSTRSNRSCSSTGRRRHRGTSAVRHPKYVILVLFACVVTLPVFTVASESSFPLEALDDRAREKVEALRNDHTLERSPRLEYRIMNPALHQFLLDRPDVGAAISRTLGIGDYTMTRTGKDTFHGIDPDGIEGNMEILYRGAGHRVFFAEGIAEGALVTVRGKVVIFQQFEYRTTNHDQEWVKSELTLYAKLENPFLAFLLKIFSPFVGKLVDPKISKAQGVVRQVNERMLQDPHGTYARIAESGQLACEDLMTLHELMKPSA
ncbi:MAG: hypothetical protein ACE5MK_13025, partial [Acidobacteriota bacterium]